MVERVSDMGGVHITDLPAAFGWVHGPLLFWNQPKHWPPYTRHTHKGIGLVSGYIPNLRVVLVCYAPQPELYSHIRIQYTLDTALQLQNIQRKIGNLGLTISLISYSSVCSAICDIGVHFQELYPK